MNDSALRVLVLVDAVSPRAEVRYFSMTETIPQL